MEAPNSKSTATEHIAPVTDHNSPSPLSTSPQDVNIKNGLGEAEAVGGITVEELENSNRGWFAYLRTRNFYLVLVLG